MALNPDSNPLTMSFYRGSSGNFTVPLSLIDYEKPVYVDDAVPIGAVDGVNQDFLLSSDPDAKPPMPHSFKLYRDGIRMVPTVDFTLSGLSLHLVTAPPLGQILRMDYRA